VAEGEPGDQTAMARERTAEARRRTHLANERTYAAWIRTALALVALGVGIAGYVHVALPAREALFQVLALAFVAGGAGMAGLATWAYRRTYASIERGEYGSGMGATLLLGAIPIAIGLLAFLLIVLWR
jgi:putative membrane protein